MKESVLRIACEGESLVGILAEPDAEPAADVGIVIIVGGPQYRAGSHRQFTLLARHLAGRGFVALRFDYRGMGDSTGPARDFLAVEPDIRAAIDGLLRARPTLQRVVLWGLCDAASAALLYLEATGDTRVAGIALCNPWVRSAQTLAQTHVKHYYWQRLREKSFWLKLLRGGVGLQALRGLGRNVRLARSGDSPREARSFQDRMAEGLRRFPGPALLVLSGNDYTAHEFGVHVQVAPAWQGLLTVPRVELRALDGADHTFSDPQAAQAVEHATLGWLRSLCGDSR